MLIHLNNKLKISFIFFFNFNFLVSAKNEKNLIIKQQLEKESKLIDQNIKQLKYKKKYFFEKSVLKKTYNYFYKKKLKKIKNIYGNESKNIYIDDYFFIQKYIILKHTNYEFSNEISMLGLKHVNLKSASKVISMEMIVKDRKILFAYKNGIQMNQKNALVELKEYYIDNILKNYIFLSKYLNLPNYRKYKGGPWGMRKRFPLCGKERALKLTYTFNKPIFIEIIDSNEERMYEIQEIPKKNKKTKIKRIFLILKNKKFDLDSIQISITSLAKGSEWDLKVEFEGDEIQIG